MPKTIIKLNASGLKYTTCDYRWFNIMVQGYYAGVNSSRIVYGVAVHKYIDTMYKTNGHIGKAREAALFAFRQPKVDDKKSMHMSDENHMLATCYNLWEDWILKDTQLETVLLADDKPACEVTFSIQKYYEDEHIQVDLEGTIDRIAKVKGGVFVINDFKSTSSWSQQSYLAKYAMSQQLRFYVFALKQMGKLFPDTALGKIGSTNIGACIDGIFLKPKACDNLYQRSEVFQFPDLVEFEAALYVKILELSNTVRYMSEGKPPLKNGLVNGSCEGKWGMCNFWNVCKAQNSEIAQILLERDFKKKVYNPLKHNEEAPV